MTHHAQGTDRRWIGSALSRLEDRRILTGEERYIRGLQRDDALWVSYVRSPVAHGRIKDIDVTEAARVPGVIGIWTGRDLTDHLAPIRSIDDAGEVEDAYYRVAREVRPTVRCAAMSPLAIDKVRYQGETVAAVVATDPYVGEDARDLVRVDYEQLPTVTDPEAALAPDAPQIHDDCPGNLSVDMHLRTGEPGLVFDEAPVVVGETFHLARNCAMAMEPRGILAEPDPDGSAGSLSVVATTQRPHDLRSALALMLRVPEDRIRVRRMAMGGGFGPSGAIYPEYAVVVHLAARLGRPVRWQSDRMEEMATAYQGRGQVHHAEAAFSHQGELLAIRDRFYVVGGAYNPVGPLLVINALMHIGMPYRFRDRDLRGRWAYTNMTPASAYRGSGRPEAAFVTERLIDRGASRLGIDPADIRLRNLITPDEMPYYTGLTWRNGRPLKFEDGDFPGALRRALKLVRYDDLRRDQAERRGTKRGKLGIGVAFSIEGGAMGSHESASVTVDRDGVIHIASGGAAHGQGHETMLAQVAADQWDVPIDQVRVRDGDTALIARGLGTWGSRGAVHTANAVRAVCAEAKELARRAGAYLLDSESQSLEFVRGCVGVRGERSRRISLGELAKAMEPAGSERIPSDLRDGLRAVRDEHFKGSSFSYAADVVVLEVDSETGDVELRDYVSVHDAGQIINPSLVDGQIHGGVVQGLSQALWENISYDQDGRLLSGGLADYSLPTAADVCSIRTDHIETPMSGNPLGTAGMASGTPMNALGSIATAVEDALGDEVTITDLPILRERLTLHDHPPRWTGMSQRESSGR